MYRNSANKEKLKIELNFTKALVIAATVLITLVIPAQVITYYKNKPEAENVLVEEVKAEDSENNTGRVAGASTSIDGSYNSGDSSNSSRIGKQASLYVYLGGFFIAISFVTLGYLIIDDKKSKSESFY